VDPETRFSAVFGLGYGPLCRYARHRGLTGPDAEDLVAQTQKVVRMLDLTDLRGQLGSLEVSSTHGIDRQTFQNVTCVDYHTAGEPFRIVTSPTVSLPGASVSERRLSAVNDPNVSSTSRWLNPVRDLPKRRVVRACPGSRCANLTRSRACHLGVRRRHLCHGGRGGPRVVGPPGPAECIDRNRPRDQTSHRGSRAGRPPEQLSALRAVWNDLLLRRRRGCGSSPPTQRRHLCRRGGRQVTVWIGNSRAYRAARRRGEIGSR
jgi:hypothetical protein